MKAARKLRMAKIFETMLAWPPEGVKITLHGKAIDETM